MWDGHLEGQKNPDQLKRSVHVDRIYVQSCQSWSELSPPKLNGLLSVSKLLGQVILNRIEAHLASAAKLVACFDKVTFRNHQFEPLHTEHQHSGTSHHGWETFIRRSGPGTKDYWAMPWSKRDIITKSVSCVTSQCDFEVWSELILV